jgi:hypothetical protein
VESRSIVNGPAGSTGPAPAAHNRASSSRVTASNSRTPAHLNARNHDPMVDGARVWSNSSPVAPACSSAVSATESPPSSIDPTTVSAFVALFARCAASRIRRSITSASPIFCASTAAGNRPAPDTRFCSSQLTDTPLRL